MKNHTVEAFFALVRAGLWENINDNAKLIFSSDVKWEKVYLLAEEQSVTGLIADGIDRIKNLNLNVNLNIPQEWALQFIGSALQLEQQNAAMNTFICNLVENMRKSGIYVLLLKGQGIAQCYEKPLWRACGDVDLLLSDDNYEKAKEYLLPLASNVEPEGVYYKHLGLTIEPWVVELHGNLRSGLSSRIDNSLDEIKDGIIFGGNVRSWMNEKTQVFLPSADNDVVYIFTHILQHFYKGGIGIRQVCDWCRLLWMYRDSLNQRLLESRIRKMGLMSEWRAFGSFAVEYLGMPVEAMPLYYSDKKCKRKAVRICSFIMEVGNFGHNRDRSYYEKYPYVIRKTISMGRRCGDLVRHARLFPLDTIKFFPVIIFNGLRSAANGE